MKPATGASGASAILPPSDPKRTEEHHSIKPDMKKTARSVTTDANEAVDRKSVV